MFDVFLSYNSKDREQVVQLAFALKERSLSVWLDIWEVRPGAKWMDRIQSALKEAQTAALLVGKNGIGPWHQQEMEAALRESVEGKKHVIPVLLLDAPLQPSLPPFLAGFSWVDLREGLTDLGLSRLVWGITGIRPEAAGLASPERVAHAIMEGNSRALYESPFMEMLTRLLQQWKPALRDHAIGALALDDATEVMFRSTATRMRPEWLHVLAKYDENHAVAKQLPNHEEVAIRELRNLGLIQHDGRWLFSPTRSKYVEPTDAGRVVLALWRPTPMPLDAISAYFRSIIDIVRDEAAGRLLREIRETGTFPVEEVVQIRALRNMNLVGHSAYYLAKTNRAMLTQLGAHVVSRL